MDRLKCETMQNHDSDFEPIKNNVFNNSKENILSRIKYYKHLEGEPLQRELVRDNVRFVHDRYFDWYKKTRIFPVMYEVTVVLNDILIRKRMNMVKRTMIAIDVFFRIIRSLSYQCHRNAFSNASRSWLPRFSCAVEQFTRNGEVTVPHVHGIIMFHPDWQDTVEACLIPNQSTIRNRLENGTPEKKPLTLHPSLIISPPFLFDEKIATVNFDEITDSDGLIEWTKYYTKGAERSRVNQDIFFAQNMKYSISAAPGFKVTKEFIRSTGYGEHFTPFRSPLTHKNVDPQFLDYKKKQKHNHRFQRLRKRRS